MKKILILQGPTDYVESWMNKFARLEFANLKITALSDEQQETLDEALEVADGTYYVDSKSCENDEERKVIQEMREDLSGLADLLLERSRINNAPSTNATNYMED